MAHQFASLCILSAYLEELCVANATGPVVRASLVRVKDALSKANITTVEGMEKKKTIAQILDEALEQEFPEQKVENIGKNYNETAKQDDVGISAS